MGIMKHREETMEFPEIYLAIDNCFASKRWTEPAEWMAIFRDLGVGYVEASADNECDPLYAGMPVLRRWLKKCRRASEATGVTVANLYSGHGTYATLGLAHTDRAVRDRILNRWLKPMTQLAGELGAGLGFFCHAFADSVLQDPERYRAAEQDLYNRLAELAAYSTNVGCRELGLEQMYSPHQIPWTLDGAELLLREVYRRSRTPFYLTVDVGHQCGQRTFQRPGREEIRSGRVQWFGPESARRMAEGGAPVEQVEREMDRYPYLFARYEDGDPYRWLERFGCYSPIIHLQQSDGSFSLHRPFTGQYNATGIVHPREVLDALARSFRQHRSSGLPPVCRRIFLTLEIFSGTAQHNSDILAKLQESVTFWRAAIPQDGWTLDKLMEKL